MCFGLVEHAETRHLGEVWISPLDVILDAERALVPIRSRVLPDFDRTLASMLRWS